MQKKDIKLWGEYAVRRGKYGTVFRVVVIHPEPIWGNRYTYAFPDFGRPKEDNYLRPSAERWGEKRWACAVEVDRLEQTHIDPATGQPWEVDRGWGPRSWPRDEEGRIIKAVKVGKQWLPLAVRSAEIVHTWATELELRRQKAEQEAIARAAYEVQQAKAEEERQQRQAHQEELRKEFERQRDLFKGQQSEFYEKHLEPLLVELGIEHKPDIIFHSLMGTANEGKYVSRATITLTFDQMYKLLERLEKP